jgi:hypothetical protein
VNHNAVNFNILRNCNPNIEKQNSREKAHEPALLLCSVDESPPRLHQALRATACQVLGQWSVKWKGSNARQSGNVFASNSRLCTINLWSNPRGFARGEGGWSQLELTLYVSFYLTKTEILRVSDSSWPSANNVCSSLHSQNTIILDCFNSYTHCKIYIYLVISTFANRNVLRKLFNHSSCPFRQFLPFETRLSSQLRRAI